MSARLDDGAEREALARLFARVETSLELGPLIDAGVGWGKIADIIPSIYPALFADRRTPDPESVRRAWQALSPSSRDWKGAFEDAAQERMLADGGGAT